MAYVKKADRVTPQGPSIEDDDATLGIGVDDDAPAKSEGPALDFTALLNHPSFAKIVDAAVAQRLAVSAPSSGSFSPEYSALLERIERSLSAKDEQRPGYMKPLTADEIQSRREGEARMWSEIETAKSRARAGGEWPKYLLTDTFNGPSAAGPVLYDSGQEINWLGAPGETFQPQNEAAAIIYAAYRQWVGKPVTVDQLLAKAAAEARGGTAIPEQALVRTGAEDIQVIEGPLRDMTPKRVLGTSGIETRGKPMAKQPGIVQQPQGPVFVGEAA